MGHFEWECQQIYPCEGIPNDACIINYCPFPVCEWPEINEAEGSISTIRAYSNGEILESDCPGVLKRSSSCKLPALKIVKLDEEDGFTTEWYDGSAARPIVIPLEEFDKILFPLIYDDRGQIRHYRPASVPGKFKIVSDGEIISPATDTQSPLSVTGVAVDSTPAFLLYANVSRLACSTGTSKIQLLKKPK